MICIPHVNVWMGEICVFTYSEVVVCQVLVFQLDELHLHTYTVCIYFSSFAIYCGPKQSRVTASLIRFIGICTALHLNTPHPSLPPTPSPSPHPALLTGNGLTRNEDHVPHACHYVMGCYVACKLLHFVGDIKIRIYLKVILMGLHIKNLLQSLVVCFEKVNLLINRNQLILTFQHTSSF